MRKLIQLSIAASAAVLLFLFAATEAEATGAARTFVSGAGTDTGTCPRTAACRSFAYALTQTNAGGEIVVLDSAGYGSVTIGQSVTITNPGGVEAGITASSGAAILISASSNISVTLRGLTLEGGGSGANGIQVLATAPAEVNIIDCVVKDFAQSGIFFAPTASGGENFMNVLVEHTVSISNAVSGIGFSPSGVFILPTIYDSVFDSNGYGVLITGAVNGSFIASHADNNTVGISVANSSNLTIKKSTATNNGGPIVTNDISANGAAVNLFDDNTLGTVTITNGGLGNSDGTNNISTGGSSLTKLTPQ